MPWYVEDLTGPSGAPLAAAGSALSGFENNAWGFREPFYLGTDQHVYHFWAPPGVPWAVEDLAGPTGAPLAAAGSGLAAWAEAGLYVSMGGQILAGGTGLAGVTVTLSGTISATTTTTQMAIIISECRWAEPTL